MLLKKLLRVSRGVNPSIIILKCITTLRRPNCGEKNWEIMHTHTKPIFEWVFCRRMKMKSQPICRNCSDMTYILVNGKFFLKCTWKPLSKITSWWKFMPIIRCLVIIRIKMYYSLGFSKVFLKTILKQCWNYWIYDFLNVIKRYNREYQLTKTHLNSTYIGPFYDKTILLC